jgi:hypothetical protein
MPTWEGPKFTTDVMGTTIAIPQLEALTPIKEIRIDGYSSHIAVSQWSGVDPNNITHTVEVTPFGLLVIDSTDIYLFCHILIDGLPAGQWTTQTTPVNPPPDPMDETKLPLAYNEATGKIDISRGTWIPAESGWVVPL